MPKLPAQHERLSWPALQVTSTDYATGLPVSHFICTIYKCVLRISVKLNVNFPLYTPWRHMGEWRFDYRDSWPQHWMVGVYLSRPRQNNRTRCSKAATTKYDVWGKVGCKFL